MLTLGSWGFTLKGDGFVDGYAGAADVVNGHFVDVERLTSERRSSERFAVVEHVDFVRSCITENSVNKFYRLNFHFFTKRRKCCTVADNGATDKTHRKRVR